VVSSDLKLIIYLQMRRIFIALKVDAGENLKDMISDFRSSLEGEKIKWVEPDNLHVTMEFLGDTEEEEIILLSSVLEEKCAGYGDFGFNLKGAGVFRNIREPRVIWAGVPFTGELQKLSEFIRSGLKEAGFSPDEMPFKPHLTIGRINSLRSGNRLATLLEKYHGFDIQKVPVKEVNLYESILKPSGPVYKPISIFNLK
jgi:RNA 2',3'-cyclic 3'-phosphodiesterase